VLSRGSVSGRPALSGMRVVNGQAGRRDSLCKLVLAMLAGSAMTPTCRRRTFQRLFRRPASGRVREDFDFLLYIFCGFAALREMFLRPVRKTGKTKSSIHQSTVSFGLVERRSHRGKATTPQHLNDLSRVRDTVRRPSVGNFGGDPSGARRPAPNTPTIARLRNTQGRLELLGIARGIWLASTRLNGPTRNGPPRF
jgi:hypothetical protein